MKGLTFALAAILALGAANGQSKTQKPAQKEPGRIVLGTDQMKGDNGKFGSTHTIGQRSPMNITLTDARFSVERFNIGANSWAPTKGEKLLILTYTIHNPNPAITHADGTTLKFTAVDQDDQNHEAPTTICNKESGDSFSMEMKPAQKVVCQTVIVVPAKGTVPKLIVQHESGGAVLRYDLRPVLKPLPAPYAGQGMDALEEIPADKGQVLPLMYFDASFLSTEFVERKFGVSTIPEDKVFFFPKFKVKKQAAPGMLRINAQAITEDGDRYNSQMIAKGSVEESASSFVDKGQELTIRLMIIVPKKAKITQIRLWEGDAKTSRIYVFPVEAQFTSSH
ncbi:MAG TPA: hypothetical protein VHE55_19045 [Fimbriimonadaceae bacterium]|nr:hypothetical protein [Fimbriimonadaceae bacterium]